MYYWRSNFDILFIVKHKLYITLHRFVFRGLEAPEQQRSGGNQIPGVNHFQY